MDTDIKIISEFLPGKRRELFAASIAVVEESIAQGCWLPRGAVRAIKGINKGLASHKGLNNPSGSPVGDGTRNRNLFEAYMSLCHGSMRLTPEGYSTLTDDNLTTIAPRVPVEVTRAWLRLLVHLREVFHDLNASRPAPIYTEIGLSRRVTATLQDAGLDLDLTTRRVCPLGSKWVPVLDENFRPVKDPRGKPKMEKVYFPLWPKGAKFGASRFSHCDCEACGKSIPSGQVVPILVEDKSGQSLGFWFGRDCARSILGIKDVGIRRELEK